MSGHRDALHRITVTALLALAVWQVCAYQRVESYGSDSSRYQVLAENLRNGKGYQFNYRPETLYPPGLPAFLAVVGSVSGFHYAGFVVLMPLFAVLGLMAAYFLVRREEGTGIAAASCLLLATSPHYFRLTTQTVMADFPYMAISLTALLLATSSAARSHPVWKGARSIGLCLLTVAAVMLRSAGIALIAAGFAYLAAHFVHRRAEAPRNRPGLMAALACGAAAEFAWVRWSHARLAMDWPGDFMTSYVSQMLMKDPHRPLLGTATLTDLASRPFAFAVAQMTHFSGIVLRLNWLEPRWFSPLAAIPFLCVSVGIVVSIVRARSSLPAWYLLAYLTLYALWPFDEGARFIVPVFPVMALFAWRGAVLLLTWERALTRAGVRAVGALLVLAAGVAAWSYSSEGTRGWQSTLSLLFWPLLLLSWALWRRYQDSILEAAAAYRRPAVILAAVIALALGVGQQVVLTVQNLNPRPETFTHAASASAAAWLRGRWEQGSVMAEHGSVLHRLTGRRVVSFPISLDGGMIARTAANHGVVFLVVNRPTKDVYFLPTEQQRLEALQGWARTILVHSGPGYDIYSLQ
jgi:hypothetical protein